MKLCFLLTFLIAVFLFLFFFFQAEDGIRDLVRSRGLGDVYKRQADELATVAQKVGAAMYQQQQAEQPAEQPKAEESPEEPKAGQPKEADFEEKKD